MHVIQTNKGLLSTTSSPKMRGIDQSLYMSHDSATIWRMEWAEHKIDRTNGSVYKAAARQLTASGKTFKGVIIVNTRFGRGSFHTSSY